MGIAAFAHEAIHLSAFRPICLLLPAAPLHRLGRSAARSAAVLVAWPSICIPDLGTNYRLIASVQSFQQLYLLSPGVACVVICLSSACCLWNRCHFAFRAALRLVETGHFVPAPVVEQRLAATELQLQSQLAPHPQELESLQTVESLLNDRRQLLALPADESAHHPLESVQTY